MFAAEMSQRPRRPSSSNKTKVFNMRKWRNWQTRTFEGRVVHTVRVQVPSSAPEISRWDFPSAYFFCVSRFANPQPRGRAVPASEVECRSRNSPVYPATVKPHLYQSPSARHTATCLQVGVSAANCVQVPSKLHLLIVSHRHDFFASDAS